jgi:hypothetical protein
MLVQLTSTHTHCSIIGPSIISVRGIDQFSLDIWAFYLCYCLTQKKRGRHLTGMSGLSIKWHFLNMNRGFWICFLFNSLLDPENGGDFFLRNVGLSRTFLRPDLSFDDMIITCNRFWAWIIRRDWIIGFIDTLYVQLGTTSNYSAATHFTVHTLHAHERYHSSQAVSWQRIYNNHTSDKTWSLLSTV